MRINPLTSRIDDPNLRNGVCLWFRLNKTATIVGNHRWQPSMEGHLCRNPMASSQVLGGELLLVTHVGHKHTSDQQQMQRLQIQLVEANDSRVNLQFCRLDSPFCAVQICIFLCILLRHSKTSLVLLKRPPIQLRTIHYGFSPVMVDWHMVKYRITDSENQGQYRYSLNLVNFPKLWTICFPIPSFTLTLVSGFGQAPFFQFLSHVAAATRPTRCTRHRLGGRHGVGWRRPMDSMGSMGSRSLTPWRRSMMFCSKGGRS